jgi:hypothetical protein
MPLDEVPIARIRVGISAVEKYEDHDATGRRQIRCGLLRQRNQNHLL